MRITAIHHGATATTFKVDNYAQVSWVSWQRALIAAIVGLNELPDFEVVVPENPDFTLGLRCTFQGKDFSFVSDNPGEVLVRFGTLRPRFSEQLMAAISESWVDVAV